MLASEVAQLAAQETEALLANTRQQGRLSPGSNRSSPSKTLEHMEPIVEEKSELAMDIAQAVVEKLDIDRKLDEKVHELMLQGDRVFREIQERQEQSVEALSRSVAICLASQRAFREEHQRLLTVVKSLASMVAPYSPYGLQAVEAHARAAALAEDAEVLKQQMEVANTALNSVTASAAALTAPPSTPPPPQPTSPTSASSQFTITLRKADDTSLGLSVTAHEESKVLIVEGVVIGGAVESWNRQCCGDADRVVVVGDRIISVNGIENDVQKMLEACTTQRLVKLVVARGPGGSRARSMAADNAQARQTKQINEDMELTPEPVSKPVTTMRAKAPEFVPMGADASPLHTIQQLAAPPGLFLRQQENSAGYKPQIAQNDVKIAVDAISGGVGQSIAAQDDGESDKEN